MNKVQNRKAVQHNDSFNIVAIEIKKFIFEQTSPLGQESEINIEQSLGAVTQKNVIDDSIVEYSIRVDTDIHFKQKEKEIFYIDSSIFSVIKTNINFNEKLLNNVVAIMYSYLRPLVAQMTTMAKLPPLDLPPANFENYEVKVVDSKKL